MHIPSAMPMTALGLTLGALSFLVSKYLTRPACDWNPPSFFLAMGWERTDSL